MTTLLILWLSGCTLADASQRPTADTHRPGAVLEQVIDGLSFDELLLADARGAALGMELVRDDLARLDPATRTEVAASMHLLVRNCPYTRASVQLPRALHRVLQETPLGAVDGGYAQSDWVQLRRGLKAHVEALDLLGAHLPLPETGDYLYRTDADWLVDDAGLAASPDPIADVLRLIEQVDPLVSGYDGVTRDVIAHHQERVSDRTGQHWVLSRHVWSWRDALTRLEPFVEEPATKAKVRQMLDALNTLGMDGC